MQITLKFSPDEVRSIFTQVARDRLGIQSICLSEVEVEVLDYNDDPVDMDAITLTFETSNNPNHAIEIPQDHTTTAQEGDQTIFDCSNLLLSHAQVLS